MTFLHQYDKFIRKKVLIGQKFLKWSDDIKPKDDITPFDGTYRLSYTVLYGTFLRRMLNNFDELPCVSLTDRYLQ